MKRKSKYKIMGDEIININLKPGLYLEKTLVNLICTPAQKKEYYKRGRFPNSQKQNMFWNRLSRYCEFEYIAGKYKIKHVFDSPITDSEIRIHKGIYQYLAPLILDIVLKNTDNNKSIVTSFALARDSDLINRNYGYMKARQDAVVTDLQIPKTTVFEYFINTDSRIDDYIEQCVKYLESLNCILYEKVYLIAVEGKLSSEGAEKAINVECQIDCHRASENEVSLYANLVDEASRAAGVVNASDRFYGKTGAKYKAILDKLLEQNGIRYMVRAFQLYRVNADRCRKILATFNDKSLDERRRDIGAVFKVIIDGNAEKRSAERPRADKNFIENFKNLSEITLLYGAEDIRPKMPSAKSYKDIMADKANNIQINYNEYTVINYK